MTPVPARTRECLSATLAARSACGALGLAVLAVLASPADAFAQQRSAPPAVQCPAGWKPVPPGVSAALRCLPGHIAVAREPGRSGPPLGCPAGWQPVPPGVNPVLRCQPGSIGVRGPARTAIPPQGCPTGWKPSPPGLNPLLRCVPGDLVFTPRPGVAIPPAGCPDGWRRVEPGVNPVLGCQPTNIAQPVQSGADGQVATYVPAQGGPKKPQGEAGRVGPGDDAAPGRDPGGPIQGAHALAAPMSPADLALIGSLQLADKNVPWGNDVSVSSDAAMFKRMGRCGFRYEYTTRNQGQKASTPTVNRVMRDAPDGDVLATKPLPALKQGEVGVSTGTLSLATGTWMLYAHADASLSVAEGDEANNLRRVRVTVQGDCG